MDQSWVRSQSKLPIVTTLQTLTQQRDAAFYAPGHKRGQGIAQSLTNFWGKSVFKADLPELPALDNLFCPEGVILEAQTLAAAAFGADRTWFLVNGSTCGIVAMILATCQTGDKLIVPRNIHQSVISGLILSGAIPIFLTPEYDPHQDLVGSLTPEALEAALTLHCDAKAVMLVYPTYQGICGDLEALVNITHRYNIPLLVDEAHGAHFAFHPQLPPSALSLGADVTVQSTHKVLGALTQASMLHLQGDRVDSQRLSQALQFLQSTSPSYLLLASLDAARQQIALNGRSLLTNTLQSAQLARNQLTEIAGISVIETTKTGSGFHDLDLTRLTVDVSFLGISGYEADEILSKQFHVTAELPLLRHLTFIISIGNTEDDIKQLIQGFRHLASSHSFTSSPPHPVSPSPCFPLTLSPREAFFAETQWREIEQAVGCISAEVICPYPPGIPVLMPGERITSEAIAYLQTVQQLGAAITGGSDSSLTRLKVVK